jgi:hypothetical protein
VAGKAHEERRLVTSLFKEIGCVGWSDLLSHRVGA